MTTIERTEVETLRAEVAELREQLEHFIATQAAEVRTGRLVVVREDGMEVVHTEIIDGAAQLHVDWPMFFEDDDPREKITPFGDRLCRTSIVAGDEVGDGFAAVTTFVAGESVADLFAIAERTESDGTRVSGRVSARRADHRKNGAADGPDHRVNVAGSAVTRAVGYDHLGVVDFRMV